MSIPSDKVLEQARNMTRMSQRAINQIVGSLRHVKRFIPQAAPWLNGIQDLQAASTKGSWSRITTAAVVLRLATRQYLTVAWDTTEDSEPNQVNIAACNGANTTACGKRDLGDFAACEVEPKSKGDTAACGVEGSVACGELPDTTACRTARDQRRASADTVSTVKVLEGITLAIRKWVGKETSLHTIALLVPESCWQTGSCKGRTLSGDRCIKCMAQGNNGA